MSGICGTIDAAGVGGGGSVDVRAMLGRMRISADDPVSAVDWPRGGLGAYRRASSRAGAAFVTVGGRRLGLCWDVELVDLGSLVRESGISGPEVDSGETGFLLAALYRRYGDGLFSKLCGEFAVAIWDEEGEKLVVATDRFRVKPVFYTHGPKGVRFASKLRGLLADASFDRSVNIAAIADYLDTSVISTPETIYRYAWKLVPGSVLAWERGDVSIRPYWTMRYEEDFDRKERDFAAEVRSVMDRAVASRLENEGGDQAIGAFLSGGIDSSTVAGILARHVGSRVKAFSIGFDEQRFDEMEFARASARHFGLEHHEYYVSAQDALDLVPRLAVEYDEPYANSSAIPAYYCVRMALEHGVRCIFAGDGGDELFAGNERYVRDKLFGYYGRIPAGLRSALVEPSVDLLARLRVPPMDKVKKYIRRASIPNPDRLFSYAPSRTLPMREEMFAGKLGEEASAAADHRAYRAWYAEMPAADELNRFMYVDLRGTISDNDLLKVTRMSELAGLKVHFPFLDGRLADLSGRIPAATKMRGLRLRSFFKGAYADFLPRGTLRKKKHGFGLPIPVWLRTHPGLSSMARDLLLSARSLQRGYFRKPFIEKVVESHRSDTTSFFGTLIWHLMMLELWHRNYHDAPG